MSLKKIKIVLILISALCTIWDCGYAHSVTRTSDAAIESTILVHINAYRHQHGLSTLTMNSEISREARIHSLDMANHRMSFGHKDFAKRINKLHAKIKNSNAGAENVAYNYKDAADVVKNWLRSPGHKRNIRGNYNLTGIGIARDNRDRIYFTQIFLKTGGTHYASHSRRHVLHFFR